MNWALFIQVCILLVLVPVVVFISLAAVAAYQEKRSER